MVRENWALRESQKGHVKSVGREEKTRENFDRFKVGPAVFSTLRGGRCSQVSNSPVSVCDFVYAFVM